MVPSSTQQWSNMSGDDMFCAAEVAVWDDQIKVYEEKKVGTLKRAKIEEAGKEIFALHKPVATLRDPELVKLIEYHTGSPSSKQGAKAKEVFLWTIILND